MAETSTNPAKVIDVQDGDTFSKLFDLYHTRDGQNRLVSWMDFGNWHPGKIRGLVAISRYDAITFLKLAGYTIRETDHHGREVVVRNENTGNYVAKCSIGGFGIFNPDGSHVWSNVYEAWSDGSRMANGDSQPHAIKYLATAPAYTPPKPEAGKVEWPTHCLCGDMSKTISAMGTKDDLEEYWAKTDHSIVPMPRPPMSAEMRAFFQSFVAADVCGEIRRTAEAVLASDATK